MRAPETEGVGFRTVTMDEIHGAGTMPMLVSALKAVMTGPVEDRTGLTGAFDIQLKWDRERAGSTDGGATEPTLSVFSAITQQLGLNLVASKVPIDVVVIDRVEHPTEN